MKNVIILLFLVISTTVSATNYYVSTSGNDAANGLSESTAWKTIAKINKTSFSPGDAILFKRGEVWRETLTVPSSGTSGSYLKFASYGSGAKPKILGSNVSSTWTDQGGNIWKSNSTFANPYASTPMSEVFFEQSAGTIAWGVNKTSTGALTAEYNWTWSSNYIYVYATSNPSSRYVSVEVPQRLFGISLNDKEYITIDGLEIRYSKYAGIDFQGSYPNLKKNGLSINNCAISYIGSNITLEGFGIDVLYTDMVVENCIIHDSGRRNISLNMYGSSNVSNITIQNNTLYNGYHTTGVDLSQSGTGTIDNVIIRNNLIYDDLNSTAPHSILIFLQKYSGAVQNIHIYNNIFKYPIYSAIQSEGVNKLYIYNNTFYDFNAKTSEAQHIYVSTGSTSIAIKNNIFYVDQNKSGYFASIYSTVSNAQIDADYNLYYRINNSYGIINIGTIYYMNSTFPIGSGWETHGVKADPKFNSATDFHLQAGSPAIGKGLAIAEVTTDAEGKTCTSPPSIGAYSSLTSVVVATNPVYVSSVIQNSTPSLVELTYNLTLANLVPSATAFSVMVNSVAKTVSNVVISGTKVQLILASPLLYSDVVKVSYTKPAANPLQTSAGGFAISISGMTVVNSITAPVKDATAATIKMTLSPNPTSKIINCAFVYSSNFSAATPAMSPQVIKIFNNSGKLYVQKSLTTGIAKYSIPINLRSGIYKVVLTSGAVEMSSQKIMVY